MKKKDWILLVIFICPLILCCSCCLGSIIKNRLDIADEAAFYSKPAQFESVVGSPFSIANTGLQEGIVLFDKNHKLKWTVSSEAKDIPFNQAKSFCDNLNNLGFAGENRWDLPSLREISTRVSLSAYKNENRYFWTTTFSGGNPTYIYLFNGYHDSTKVGGAAVMCVARS